MGPIIAMTVGQFIFFSSLLVAAAFFAGWLSYRAKVKAAATPARPASAGTAAPAAAAAAPSSAAPATASPMPTQDEYDAERKALQKIWVMLGNVTGQPAPANAFEALVLAPDMVAKHDSARKIGAILGEVTGEAAPVDSHAALPLAFVVQGVVKSAWEQTEKIANGVTLATDLADAVAGRSRRTLPTLAAVWKAFLDDDRSTLMAVVHDSKVWERAVVAFQKELAMMMERNDLLSRSPVELGKTFERILQAHIDLDNSARTPDEAALINKGYRQRVEEENARPAPPAPNLTIVNGGNGGNKPPRQERPAA